LRMRLEKVRWTKILELGLMAFAVVWAKNTGRLDTVVDMLLAWTAVGRGRLGWA